MVHPIKSGAVTAAPCTPVTFNTLPTDVLVHIFSYLTPKDFLSAILTCQAAGVAGDTLIATSKIKSLRAAIFDLDQPHLTYRSVKIGGLRNLLCPIVGINKKLFKDLNTCTDLSKADPLDVIAMVREIKDKKYLEWLPLIYKSAPINRLLSEEIKRQGCPSSSIRRELSISAVVASFEVRAVGVGPPSLLPGYEHSPMPFYQRVDVKGLRSTRLQWDQLIGDSCTEEDWKIIKPFICQGLDSLYKKSQDGGAPILVHMDGASYCSRGPDRDLMQKFEDDLVQYIRSQCWPTLYYYTERHIQDLPQEFRKGG